MQPEPADFLRHFTPVSLRNEHPLTREIQASYRPDFNQLSTYLRPMGAKAAAPH